MHIGSVAEEIGLTPEAVRFYERNALLPQAPRTQKGFRQYGESEVETLAAKDGLRVLRTRLIRSCGEFPWVEKWSCTVSLAECFAEK